MELYLPPGTQHTLLNLMVKVRMDRSHGTVFIIISPLAASLNPVVAIGGEHAFDALPQFLIVNHTDSPASVMQSGVSLEVGPPVDILPKSTMPLAWDEPVAAVQTGRSVVRV